jgi:hypothetical protein
MRAHTSKCDPLYGKKHRLFILLFGVQSIKLNGQPAAKPVKIRHCPATVNLGLNS